MLGASPAWTGRSAPAVMCGAVQLDNAARCAANSHAKHARLTGRDRGCPGAGPLAGKALHRQGPASPARPRARRRAAHAGPKGGGGGANDGRGGGERALIVSKKKRYDTRVSTVGYQQHQFSNDMTWELNPLCLRLPLVHQFSAADSTAYIQWGFL